MIASYGALKPWPPRKSSNIAAKMVKTTEEIIEKLLQTSNNQNSIDNLQIREVLKHLLAFNREKDDKTKNLEGRVLALESTIQRVARGEVFTKNKRHSRSFDILFAINVPHILEKIFLSLDYESFKNCVKVNDAWKNLLTSEAFKRKWMIVYQEAILTEGKFIRQDSKKGKNAKYAYLWMSYLISLVLFWEYCTWVNMVHL